MMAQTLINADSPTARCVHAPTEIGNFELAIQAWRGMASAAARTLEMSLR